jgi:hypothetical protein
MPTAPSSPPPRQFDFARDAFAFPNELVWEYEFGADGSARTRRRQPPPTYAHRCFVLARSARQFLYHARFEPAGERFDAAVYRQRVRTVVRRSPRVPCPEEDRIVLPGYDGLRGFSREWEAVLKAECGAAWESYALRSHWRMVFPISRRHQATTAARLSERIRSGFAPIVHLVRFPQLTINHGVVLFASRDAAGGREFVAYDPNRPDEPATLFFNAAHRTFLLPPNTYWPGGQLDVIEIYRSWWF